MSQHTSEILEIISASAIVLSLIFVAVDSPTGKDVEKLHSFQSTFRQQAGAA